MSNLPVRPDWYTRAQGCARLLSGFCRFTGGSRRLRPRRAMIGPRWAAYAAAVELHLRVDGRGDRTRQVYQQVRAAIADGLLRPGEAVPSSRELARRLGVARNTVTLAYDRLTAEGFLRSRVGAGTFVCAEGLSPVSRPPADSPLRPRPLWDGIDGGPDMSAIAAEYDFRAGIPDARRFPFATWRALPPSSSARPPSAAARTSGRRACPRCGPRSPGTSASRAGCARTPRTCWSRAAASRRSTWWPGCCWRRVTSSPSRTRATRRRATRSARSAAGSSGCRWTREGLVVDALPGRRAAGLREPVPPVPARDGDVAAQAPALLDWAERRRRRHRRGRLRQRVPLRGPARSNRCTGSTPPAGCSTSARSRRCCCRRCGWAS